MSNIIWTNTPEKGVVSFKIFVACRDQLAINRYHYELNDKTAAPYSDSNMITDFKNVFDDVYADCLPIQATIIGYKITREVTPNPPYYIFENAIPIPGDIAGAELLPMQTSGIITKRSGVNGRHGRGRNYFPFPWEDANTPEGNPSGIYLALLGGVAEAVASEVAAGPFGDPARWKPVIYGKTQLGVPIISPLIQAQRRPRWGTHRSRGGFGALNRPVVT